MWIGRFAEFGNPIMSEYVRIEFHCYIFVSMTNLACGGTGLISVFCCIWITTPAWLWAQVRLRVVPVPVSFLLFLFRLRSWRVVGAVQVIWSWFGYIKKSYIVWRYLFNHSIDVFFLFWIFLDNASSTPI